jgi:hypothetical protein
MIEEYLRGNNETSEGEVAKVLGAMIKITQESKLFNKLAIKEIINTYNKTKLSQVSNYYYLVPPIYYKEGTVCEKIYLNFSSIKKK